MKTMKIFAMVMVSMFSASVNASELQTPEPSVVSMPVHLEYNYETAKTEYEVVNGEVVSKIIYKWSEKEENWKPNKKYAVSKSGDNTFLSCGNWDDSTQSFSKDLTCQSYPTAQFPRLLALPRAK